MTCHYVKDGICQGRTRIEVMALWTVYASRYGWTNRTVSFVEDAPHTWRVLWRAPRKGRQNIWHSFDTYQTQKEARNAWDLALAVEALS